MVNLNPIRRLFHWGPIAVLCIIKLISWAMMYVPQGYLGGALPSVLFLTLASCTLYFFLQSLLEGPGYVPLGWKPENEDHKQYLQSCAVCKGYKAPRSHHCRKCGYCVIKMDHHCPWINCCVGHANHSYFTAFLISAILGCLHAAIVLTLCVYYALNREWYAYHGSGLAPAVRLTLTSLLFTLLAIGMSVGVVIAVGALLFFQIRGILRNQTTIEEWIIEKAVKRREERRLPPFRFPYDLGWRRNLRALLWDPPHDGLRWPVGDGCGEFDLTREQQAQKADKRDRSRLYTATRSYSGAWVPLVTWPRAALAYPCTDEPRLPLAPGDVVRATRQKRQWLFGQKVSGAEAASGRGPRGWFPGDCAVPTDRLAHQD